MLPRLLATTFLLFLGSTSCTSQDPRGSGDGRVPPVSSPAPDAGATTDANAIDARQVHWQRSLADAEQLAKATGRPLLLALNMDGESASDRIVHEEYRDARFVALSRHCVCVGASVFRHNARDYDDQGRRIPCPRFGRITCGEHMALEPVVYEKYLADGERVAPRHALVRGDGSKAFDLSLCFDLVDIDRALAAAVDGSPRLALPEPGTDWPALAARRDQAGRTALEAAISTAADEATLRDALAALASDGDAGALPALWLLAARAPDLSPSVGERLVTVAAGLGLGAELQTCLRDLAQAPGAALDDPGPEPRQRVFLTLAGDAALADACAPLRFLLQTADAVTRREPLLPKSGGPTDEMPEAGELERTLERLDQTAKEHRDDPAWLAEFAKASLDLGRRRVEAKARGAELLLEDAARCFDRALAKEPQHYAWWIERARTAYFLGRFADEVHAGERAFAVLTGGDVPTEASALCADAVADNGQAIEALRWLGDGQARLLGERPDLERVASGLRALGAVAASAFGSEGDWVTFASFCGLCGLDRASSAVAYVGARRYPASRELRQALNFALFRRGPALRLPAAAEALARATGGGADAAWFAGFAWILAGEDARRSAHVPAALRAYHEAGTWFQRAAAANADYRASCDWFGAVALAGLGLAATDIGDRETAADALVAAVALHADLASLRDGLGCDVLDLVDKILEWRADGPSTVRPLALLDRLDAIAPETPFWALAVGDSALREALRDDGRNPERCLRATVDASGKPITMPMGLPTAGGDRWLADSIAACRRAEQRGHGDEARHALAQGLTILAERQLERGSSDGVQAALAEAAPLLRKDAPPAFADEAELRAVAARLRSQLGEARPRLREGR